jgi:hypothetical protein
LARGDAFKNPFAAKILTKLQMLPIYRLSEGVENLGKNEVVFQQCVSLLEKKQSILIFSEGLCINDWRLRPLKKGTARIALLCKKANLNDVLIQPLNINYDTFDKFPKKISINYNQNFSFNDIDYQKEPQFYQDFNSILKERIADKLVLKENISSLTPKPSLESGCRTAMASVNLSNNFKSILLATPALIGYLTQRWFFDITRNFVRKKTKNTVFFDSILFGLLMFTYPFFVLTSTLCVFIITKSYLSLLALLLLPATAFCYREWKVLND